MEAFIDSAGPDQGQPANRTIRDQLDEFAQTLQQQLGQHPVVESRLQRTIGRLYMKFHQWKKAEPFLRRALKLREDLSPSDAIALAESQADWANWLLANSMVPPAEDNVDKALPVLRASGPSQSLIEALEVRVGILHIKGETAESRDVIREIFEICKEFLGESHSTTLRYQARVASIVRFQLGFQESERMLDDALEKILQVRPALHMDVAAIKFQIARRHFRLKDFPEAERMVREAIEVHERLIGEDSAFGVNSWVLLGRIRRSQGDRQGAIEAARKAVEAAEKGSSEVDSKRLAAYSMLAFVTRQDSPEESAEMMERAIEAHRRLAPNNPALVEDLCQLGMLYHDLQRWDEADRAYFDALTIARANSGSRSALIDTIVRRAEFLKRIDRHTESAELFGEAISLAPEYRVILKLDYLRSLLSADRVEEAARFVAELEKQGQQSHVPRMNAVASAAQACMMLHENRFDEAEKLISKAVGRLGIRRLNALLVSRLNGIRAECFLAMGDLAMAESILLKSAEDSAGNVFRPMDRRRIGLQLTTLYENWGKPDQASKWKGLVRLDEAASQERARSKQP